MRERRRDYEMMIVISPLHADEESVMAIVDRLKQTITDQGGELTDLNYSSPWGRRKLAYPIREYAGGEASRRNFTEGFYVLMHFTLASMKVLELERTIKLTDPILRHMITLVERRKHLSRDESAAEMAGETHDDSEEKEKEEELVEESDD
ncbi:MAG: 30S ribosomal protein S6 [Chloroflexales bacterium]|nr:30S ribosomal protein S6 [Chloroflexales bacterium]